ncbi:type II toxin-antitoxin system VapC family toxin [Nonomuraea sp. 3N208]|uniref:type II toxin-antitoxin system VapC family toxin n=1 Tax=Nonomuraea sp. 3N208 TaxID=3457421 RepID=UPI003FCD2157
MLDAQALSLLSDNHADAVDLVEVAREDGYAATVSVVTLAEQRRTGQAAARMRWLRSRLVIMPVTEQLADLAATLLECAGLDGHDNVIDALVTATAASTNAPGRLLTSDGSHIPALCKAAVELGSRQIQWLKV